MFEAGREEDIFDELKDQPLPIAVHALMEDWGDKLMGYQKDRMIAGQILNTLDVSQEVKEVVLSSSQNLLGNLHRYEVNRVLRPIFFGSSPLAEPEVEAWEMLEAPNKPYISLYKLQSTGLLLGALVKKASLEDRVLNEKEISEIKRAFVATIAAEKYPFEKIVLNEDKARYIEELELLSENISLLAQIEKEIQDRGHLS